jgi:signal transduction histidine kinase
MRPMRLRSRLVLAFAYILLAVLVALTVPLAVNLARRDQARLETDTLLTAQTLAAYVGAENLTDLDRLQAIADAAPPEIERVVIMGLDGVVVYDSSGGSVGANFANGRRPEVDEALRGSPNAEVRYSQTEARNILVAAAPIIDEAQVGAIRLTRDFTEVDDARRQSVIGLSAIGVAALGAGVLIAFGLAGSLSEPIQRLAKTARRLGGGDLSARTGDVAGSAEVQELAGSFDEMADRLERAVQAQREFVANASHQLRTPLTGMKLRLETAAADAPPGDLRHQIEAAEREVDRLSAIVDRLLAVSRDIERGVPTEVELGDAVRRAVDRWSERAERRGSTLVVAGRTAAVQANPTDVDQILDNLLDNALAYAPGTVEIETGTSDGRAWLSVRDHGPGIPAGEHERVLERFSRGQAAPPGGSGLGLAIARELAQKWGGDLTISDPPDGGTSIRVRLRTATEPHPPEESP